MFTSGLQYQLEMADVQSSELRERSWHMSAIGPGLSRLHEHSDTAPGQQPFQSDCSKHHRKHKKYPAPYLEKTGFKDVGKESFSSRTAPSSCNPQRSVHNAGFWSWLMASSDLSLLPLKPGVRRQIEGQRDVSPRFAQSTGHALRTEFVKICRTSSPPSFERAILAFVVHCEMLRGPESCM